MFVKRAVTYIKGFEFEMQGKNIKVQEKNSGSANVKFSKVLLLQD